MASDAASLPDRTRGRAGGRAVRGGDGMDAAWPAAAGRHDVAGGQNPIGGDAPNPLSSGGGGDAHRWRHAVRGSVVESDGPRLALLGGGVSPSGDGRGDDADSGAATGVG